jgi:hypothetical protein
MTGKVRLLGLFAFVFSLGLNVAGGSAQAQSQTKGWYNVKHVTPSMSSSSPSFRCGPFVINNPISQTAAVTRGESRTVSWWATCTASGGEQVKLNISFKVTGSTTAKPGYPNVPKTMNITRTTKLSRNGTLCTTHTRNYSWDVENQGWTNQFVQDLVISGCNSSGTIKYVETIGGMQQ